MESKLEQILQKYIEINDRFTFDKLFRDLLRSGYDYDESKDIMLYCCNLSALVVQERIENRYYLQISEQETISPDLVKLFEEMLSKHTIRKEEISLN
jgi:hypothetical protein